MRFFGDVPVRGSPGSMPATAALRSRNPSGRPFSRQDGFRERHGRGVRRSSGRVAGTCALALRSHSGGREHGYQGRVPRSGVVGPGACNGSRQRHRFHDSVVSQRRVKPPAVVKRGSEVGGNRGGSGAGCGVHCREPARPQRRWGGRSPAGGGVTHHPCYSRSRLSRMSTYPRRRVPLSPAPWSGGGDRFSRRPTRAGWRPQRSQRQ